MEIQTQTKKLWLILWPQDQVIFQGIHWKSLSILISLYIRDREHQIWLHNSRIGSLYVHQSLLYLFLSFLWKNWVQMIQQQLSSIVLKQCQHISNSEIFWLSWLSLKKIEWKIIFLFLFKNRKRWSSCRIIVQ